MGSSRENTLLLQKKEKLMTQRFILVILLLFVLPRSHARDARTFSEDLRDAADFVVDIRGGRLDEFDIGLGKESAQGGVRRFYVGRDLCRPFFLKLRHKEFILVQYWVLSLEGEARESEVERTAKYFKEAGYKRIVLLQYYNQGVEVLKDDSNVLKAGMFIGYGK